VLKSRTLVRAAMPTQDARGNLHLVLELEDGTLMGLRIAKEYRSTLAALIKPAGQ
jgi:hypothetical protein